VSVRVLLADDQALVRAGFRMVLEAQADIEVVGEAADGRQAVEGTRRLRPDVVLMDIRMPIMDGIQATRELCRPGAATPATPVQRPSRLERLTERERDVLELVARGLSNAEIAKELMVGAATVKTHVTHVLTKLDLRDRVQAVIYAYEAGVVQPGPS